MKYAAVLAALVMIVSTFAPAAVASAAEADDSVTWSVRPGSGDDTDGRSWIEWEAAPGDQRVEHMVVTNHSSKVVTFHLTSADGYFTDTGRFNMLPSDQKSVAAGTWIDLGDSVVVAAGASEVVPFTVTVPENATPGDHAAGVAASILSQGEGTVGVESRVGFRVMTRVLGDLVPGLGVAVSGSYKGQVNPFQSGTVDVAYDITNTGNTRLRTQPEVVVSGPFGIGSQRVAGSEIVEIAPGETRRATARVSSTWPLFLYDVRATAEPLPVTDDLSFDDAEQASAQTAVVAMPWSQLVVVLVAFALLMATLWRRRRDRQRTARLIVQAREDAIASVRGASAQPEESAPVATPRASKTVPSSRRAARGAGAIALAVGILAAGTLWPHAGAQAADDDALRGVDVTVEISPLATSTPTPTPTPTPASPAEAGNEGDLGSSDDAPALASTGSDFSWKTVTTAAGLLIVAGLVTTIARRRNGRTPRPGDHP